MPVGNESGAVMDSPGPVKDQRADSSAGVLLLGGEKNDSVDITPAEDVKEASFIMEDAKELNHVKASGNGIHGDLPLLNGGSEKETGISDAIVATSPKQTDSSASFLRAARAGNLDKVLEFLKGETDINTCNSNGLNALHLASKEGHTQVVSALLERGANVDAATKKGNTALHIASLAGQEDIVRVLVEAGAAVNTQSQNGFTPLYMAAQENHDIVVRFLLSNGANQSLATEDGFTPLAVALQQGHDKVVAVLLENDTRGKVRLPALHIAAKKDDSKAAALLLHTDHNPDVTSKSGFTPLHIAAHYGNENVASLLLQRGADPNYVAKHQITPLHVASKWGKGKMVGLLLEKGGNIEAKTRDGLTPLHCAARSGHETVVDMLLEKGAPISAKTKNGLTPLHMASQGDHTDAARILLYHKAPVDDVTVDFLTALHVAAHCGHVRVAKLLLDRKADPNSRALNGFTPLHIACKKNRIKVVELLLKHGASIEATTESGLTPLHVASFMGCMNIVIYLLQHNASPDVPTVRGETPLHLAARASQTDIIRILLRNSAQVDARAREQQTALHIASRLGNTDIVVLLLQHGAAADATTKDHYTPLHIAAKEGQEEVANILLEHGASLTATTKKGFTPLHLAAKYGNLKVARILIQKDAPVDAQGKNGVTPLHVAAHYDHQNVALLLLDKGASPHALAKNGFTPLHIAARKNQMDIATTLLEYGASANAESKTGFIPLHLSSQEGHVDMSNLLIEHGASANAAAKNGLTPLHLSAQEDHVGVAAVLVKEGADVDAVTKAGYTPLHVACHFGQMNMVKFLLQHGAKVDATTKLGYTPLHQAAQQGHTLIINLLLENKAEPNMETQDGKTPLSIAQRLGYISVVETLKVVTETKVTTNTTTVTEEKYKVVVPESMLDGTFLSESEDEGGDDTMLGDQSYRFLTVDEMKSLGDDSLPIDEKMDISFQSQTSAAAPIQQMLHDYSPQHVKEAPTYIKSQPADNVDFIKPPILAGPESLNTTMNTSMTSEEPQIIPIEVVQRQQQNSTHSSGEKTPVLEDTVEQVPVQKVLATVTTADDVTDKLENDISVDMDFIEGWEQFLVSFMVDARGGAMRGCRHSGVRVIIPPRKAAMPMRITCRYLKKDKLVHAPPLMEGEALASRILEMGPTGAKFLGPVIIEVPHFASLRGKEREIVILRSDNGETWREHTLEATEEAVQEVLNESFDGEDLKQLEELNTNRITRILTTDFPQYFAIVTRIRQEVHAIGPEGGMVSSTVVPQVQAVFPQGALTKKIKVGLQAQPISPELVAKLLGNRVAVSPIVTVEPRRRKFHKPITLTIPVPQASSKGMINQYSGEAPTLRLLCSITGGTTRAQWEDVTGSTPLTFVNDCVSFTTTVSARFWLMDCTNIPEAMRMATELYREAIHVPFMAKFVVFSKRHQIEEARVRVFCMTDDKEDKTLETQEHFIEVAKSRDVEVLEGKTQYLEFAGNLVPVTKSGDQLAFNFYAFRENRLPFTVRVKDQNADPVGKVLFMRQPKVGRGDPPQSPICNLNLSLPENVQPEPAPSEPDLLSLEKKYAFLSISKADTIHKADLRLSDISNMLDSDWVALARELDISDSDINIIKSQYPENAPQQAVVMIRLWMQDGNKTSGNELEKALRKIGREDIINQCIFNVVPVTDDIEKAMAKAQLDQSGFDSLKRELGPSADTSMKKEESLEASYDEKDITKEAESAEEEDTEKDIHELRNKQSIPPKGAAAPPDLSPTYETEEKKYAAEEKIITEEKICREESMSERKFTEEWSSTSQEIYPKDEKIFSVEEKISKEDLISKEEKYISERKSEERTEKIGDSISVQKKEEERAELEEKLVEQKKEKLEETKIIQDVDTNVIQTKMEEKEVYEEKIHEEKLHEQRISEERTFTTKIPSEDKRPESVHEVITPEKRVIDEELIKPSEKNQDKSELLQKLGEELGKLDEKLEEKFREKSTKAHHQVFDGEEVEEEEILVHSYPEKVIPTSQVIVEDPNIREERIEEHVENFKEVVHPSVEEVIEPAYEKEFLDSTPEIQPTDNIAEVVLEDHPADLSSEINLPVDSGDNLSDAVLRDEFRQEISQNIITEKEDIAEVVLEAEVVDDSEQEELERISKMQRGVMVPELLSEESEVLIETDGKVIERVGTPTNEVEESLITNTDNDTPVDLDTELTETLTEAIIEPVILTQPSSEPSSLSTDKEPVQEEPEIIESSRYVEEVKVIESLNINESDLIEPAKLNQEPESISSDRDIEEQREAQIIALTEESTIAKLTKNVEKSKEPQFIELHKDEETEPIMEEPPRVESTEIIQEIEKYELNESTDNNLKSEEPELIDIKEFEKHEVINVKEVENNVIIECTKVIEEVKQPEPSYVKELETHELIQSTTDKSNEVVEKFEKIEESQPVKPAEDIEKLQNIEPIKDVKEQDEYELAESISVDEASRIEPTFESVSSTEIFSAGESDIISQQPAVISSETSQDESSSIPPTIESLPKETNVPTSSDSLPEDEISIKTEQMEELLSDQSLAHVVFEEVSQHPELAQKQTDEQATEKEPLLESLSDTENVSSQVEAATLEKTIISHDTLSDEFTQASVEEKQMVKEPEVLKERTETLSDVTASEEFHGQVLPDKGSEVTPQSTQKDKKDEKKEPE